MIHIIIVGLLFTFGLVVWNLVHSSSRSLAMLIPERVSLIFGAVLLPLGAFSALAAGHGQQNTEGFIGSIVIALVGLWFLLMRPVGSDIRGDTEQLVRRVFILMAMLMAVLVASFYIGENRLIGVANLLLVAAGFWLTTNYLRNLDRGS